MECRVVEKRSDARAARDLYPADGQWVAEVPEIDELAVDFRGHGRHLVTQAEIESQIGSDPPIILHVSAEDALANIARCESAWNPSSEFAGIIRQKGP